MTTAVLVVTFLVAVTDWVAVARNWKRVEYLAKPATMILLLVYLAMTGGFHSTPRICFGLGIFFSLAGDVFLMISYARFSNRWFLPGLAAFLLAHVAYIVGLNSPLPNISPFWSLGLAVLLALTASRVLRRIVAGVRAKGLPRMVAPIVSYGTVITLMLLSALLTLYRADWKTGAAGLVALGAALFYLSDIILAWNRYVTPVKNGRVFNMAAYHLGQIALITGAVIQFVK
jgi:uncharacterized membrane protein YhhN